MVPRCRHPQCRRVVGLFVAGTVASLAVDWYRISSLEGGSGYFVADLSVREKREIEAFFAASTAFEKKGLNFSDGPVPRQPSAWSKHH